MSPSPGQIMNDMRASAAYWRKRDRYVAQTCEIAAMIIRDFIDATTVDGRTFSDLHRRVLNLTGGTRSLSCYQGAPNLQRAMDCAFDLRNRRNQGGR